MRGGMKKFTLEESVSFWQFIGGFGSGWVNLVLIGDSLYFFSS